MSTVITPYSCVSKILKVPVFRLSLGNDLISRILIAVHNFFSNLCSKRGFRSFDATKALTSLNRFQALGANVQFVTPRDGSGKIQMMTFKSADLEQKIIAAGGSWVKCKRNEKEVFEIQPPTVSTQAWKSLEEKLNHFQWKKENGVFITCDSADEIPDNNSKCFLYAHSTSSAFTSDWKRAGFYLGAKQDLCFFDNGNTWLNSGRPISEEAFYLEIEKVHEEMLKTYQMQDVWVGGSCGGAPVAAYLKYVHHGKGINFFVEQSFSDLDDFTKPISSFFAPRVKGSLSGAPLVAQNRPPACEFSPAKLWANLPQSPTGKCILVEVDQDEHISPTAYRNYLQLAQKVNTSVSHIFYQSKAAWHHSDDFFKYEQPRRAFLHAVFH